MADSQFVIRLLLDSEGVKMGVEGATKAVERLGERMLELFAFEKLKEGFDKIVEKGRQIADVAKKWGASTDFVQSIGYAAKQGSVDMENLEKAFRNVQKAQVAAIEGGKEGQKVADAFERVGISAEGLKKLKPDELFLRIAKGLGDLPAGARTTADALLLLGRTGDTLLPAFREHFEEVAKGAKEAGQVIEKDVVNSLSEVGKRLEALKNKWVVALAPGVAKLAEMVSLSLEFVTTWAKAAGSAAGTIAGGGSFEDAMKAMAETVKEEARKSAEEASHKPSDVKTQDASNVEKQDKKEKEKRAKEPKPEGHFETTADSEARRGVFVGGRGGVLTQIPQQTLAETRAMRQRLDKIIELQREAIRHGNPLLAEIRALNRGLLEDSP
jgi:hypothetical protein